MADVTIWSKFPIILMPIVIEQTSDLSTLNALCEATRGSSYLHLLCLREIYRVYSIEQGDLLRVPWEHRDIWYESSDDECYDDEIDGERKETPSANGDKLGRLRSNPQESFYQDIGPHIKLLNLNFQFRSPAIPDELIESEDVLYTIASLLPYTSRLEEIDHDGLMHQELLDCLIATPNLRVLKVRKTWSAQPCTWSGLRRPPDDLLLNWNGVGALSLLKTLHISHLFDSEAQGLASAIRRIPHLENLYVAASPLLTPRGNTISSDDRSHLITLLTTLNRPTRAGKGETSLGFPVSLKYLALVDINAVLNPSVLPDLSNYSSLTNLKNLYLDLLFMSGTIYLLDVLKPANLVQLSIPHLPTLTHPAWRSLNDRLEYHRETLNQITLLNAWLNFQPNTSDISPPWSAFMDVCHVYLSEHPKTYFYRNEYNKLRWRVFGNNEHSQKWGSSVRRMRIDQVNLDDLEVDRIDKVSDGLSNLHVLVLRPQPKQLYGPLSSSVTRSLPYLDEPFGPELPDEVHMLKEGKIAEAIGAQYLPSLRIIAIGRYRFWVEQVPISNADDCRGRKIWFLRRALQNAEQEAEILQTVNKEDWEFLSDRSDCLAEKAPQEHVRGFNRLVYRKKNAWTTPRASCT